MARLYASPENDQLTAECPKSDDEFPAVRVDGAGAAEGTLEESLSALESFPPIYSASAAVSASYNGVSVVGSGYAESTISQEAADKMAHCIALMRADRALQEQAPPFIGGWGATCLFPTAMV
jgi:hypothetical protein